MKRERDSRDGPGRQRERAKERKREGERASRSEEADLWKGHGSVEKHTFGGGIQRDLHVNCCSLDQVKENQPLLSALWTDIRRLL